MAGEGKSAGKRAGERTLENLGIYGFGAAAHILAQVAVAQGRRVYAFTRIGDAEAQAFARRVGATWAGGSEETPPEALDAAIIFAPVGALVPAALRAVKKGGRVVCGGIHMSDIPSFPYRILWEERQVLSVANLTREDAHEIPGGRAPGGCEDGSHALSAGRGNGSARGFARGPFAGGCGARSVKSLNLTNHCPIHRR
jgi:threonine dehydrogenase-like Zn-dependent dehydrogenase